MDTPQTLSDLLAILGRFADGYVLETDYAEYSPVGYAKLRFAKGHWDTDVEPAEWHPDPKSSVTLTVEVPESFLRTEAGR